jgi:integrase/recombinase XerD
LAAQVINPTSTLIVTSRWADQFNAAPAGHSLSGYFTQETAMLASSLSRSACLARLITHLQTAGYSRKVIETYPGPVKRFLNHLDKQGLTILSVQRSDVERYVNGLQMVKKRRGRATAALRRIHHAAISMLLGLVRESWPPQPAPVTKREVFQRQLIDEYESWMKDIHGSAAGTRKGCRAEAQRFLSGLGVRGHASLSALGVNDLDGYVQSRGAQLCRSSLAGVIDRLKNFLRYLHFSGATPTDLSAALRAPRIYEAECIPAALGAEEVRQVLQSSRQARSPLGRRDHAICTLLATYGFRAGEIIDLRLEDIDWRNEILRIRHLKTNNCSQLPLLREPARALLAYLRHGRPKTTVRQVFLRSMAPYRPLGNSASVHHIIQRYLSENSKRCPGRKGSHAFRHARAVGLLRAAVPLKTIGDVLGHRSVRSTIVYLKLATQDLRAVALEVPGGVSP